MRRRSGIEPKRRRGRTSSVRGDQHAAAVHRPPAPARSPGEPSGRRSEDGRLVPSPTPSGPRRLAQSLAGLRPSPTRRCSRWSSSVEHRRVPRRRSTGTGLEPVLAPFVRGADAERFHCSCGLDPLGDGLCLLGARGLVRSYVQDRLLFTEQFATPARCWSSSSRCSRVGDSRQGGAPVSGWPAGCTWTISDARHEWVRRLGWVRRRKGICSTDGGRARRDLVGGDGGCARRAVHGLVRPARGRRRRGDRRRAAWPPTGSRAPARLPDRGPHAGSRRGGGRTSPIGSSRRRWTRSAGAPGGRW